MKLSFITSSYPVYQENKWKKYEIFEGVEQQVLCLCENKNNKKTQENISLGFSIIRIKNYGLSVGKQ